MERGQEANYKPILPTQDYVEISSDSSLNSGGSVTRSRAKAYLEETYERKEEEIESIAKKGRKPNKFHRELEKSREKETGKKSSLDHLERSYLTEQ